MTSDDLSIERVRVDGQTLLLPSDEAWRHIESTGSLDGRPIAVGRILSQHLRLAETHPELLIALGAVPEPDKPWWVYQVVLRDGVHHRVRLERQRCACGWAGVTGNPRDFAIYIGTADPLATLKSHESEPNLGCPNCSAALPRPAIFIAADAPT